MQTTKIFLGFTFLQTSCWFSPINVTIHYCKHVEGFSMKNFQLLDLWNGNLCDWSGQKLFLPKIILDNQINF